MKPLFSVNKRAVIALVGCFSLTVFMALDVFFPSLPALKKNFMTTESLAQWTIASYLIGFSLSQLIYGPLSDRWGRRPILIVGFVIFILGSLGCLWVDSIYGIIFARLLQGIGGGAGAAMRIVLRDLFTGKEYAKMLSLLVMGVGIVFAVAPAIGGIIQDHFDYRGNFVLMLVMGIISLTVVLLFLPETNRKVLPTLNVSQIVQSYAIVAKNKIFMSCATLTSLAMAVFVGYLLVTPFLMQDVLGLSAKQYGLYIIIIASGEFVGAYLNFLLLKKFSTEMATWIGLVFLLTAALLLWSFHFFHIFNVASIVFICTLAVMSTGLTAPNVSAQAFSLFEESIGTAGAMFGATQAVLVAIAAYLITFLDPKHPISLAIVVSGLAFGSLVLFIYIRNIKMMEDRNNAP
jgi:DHA1 family bicyclomycin/chloramphenicol resistance-like MFS transporter/DHA1 family 2-module integral membrane pump EmrD-like MFS transporter